ncbi:MAG: hypothetical protein C4B59_15200 [Candidatus Methanogaster sp.]|uniref:Uncharacterized protein n=1 Tax=Candidatus Methanogaster sp. TaxID=3386292 RepID=A0AC61KZ31_9EURY|nr:MAG: hypothetical protein C4B59_15200 [ANME-2 cluster archaeon]
MAQIFISHSGKDKDLRDFFSNAFAGTKVKVIFEEFEKIFRDKVTSEQIAKDIGQATINSLPECRLDGDIPLWQIS